MLRKLTALLFAFMICLTVFACKKGSKSNSQESNASQWVYYGYFFGGEPIPDLLNKIKNGDRCGFFARPNYLTAGRFSKVNGRELYTENVCSPGNSLIAQETTVRTDRVYIGRLKNGMTEDMLKVVRKNKIDSYVADYAGNPSIILSREIYDRFEKECALRFPLQPDGFAHAANQKHALVYYADADIGKEKPADFAKRFFRKGGFSKGVGRIYSAGVDMVNGHEVKRKSSCDFTTGGIWETADYASFFDKEELEKESRKSRTYTGKGQSITLIIDRSAFDKLWRKCRAKAGREIPHHINDQKD